MKTPNPYQLGVLRKLIETGQPLVHRAANVWTYLGCTPKTPAWSCGTSTVKALLRAGWVERAHLHEDLCHDHLHLTEAGRAAAPISTESAERATA